MVNFQRMKDELDDLGTNISSRVPVIGKTGCVTILLIALFFLFIVGFAIGYGTSRGSSSSRTAAFTDPQVSLNKAENDGH